MAARNAARRSIASAIAGVERHNGTDDPRLPDLRRDLRAVELEEHIQKVVDQAPPLTAEQRSRLAAYLQPTGRGPVAA